MYEYNLWSSVRRGHCYTWATAGSGEISVGRTKVAEQYEYKHGEFNRKNVILCKTKDGNVNLFDDVEPVFTRVTFTVYDNRIVNHNVRGNDRLTGVRVVGLWESMTCVCNIPTGLLEKLQAEESLFIPETDMLEVYKTDFNGFDYILSAGDVQRGKVYAFGGDVYYVTQFMSNDLDDLFLLSENGSIKPQGLSLAVEHIECVAKKEFVKIPGTTVTAKIFGAKTGERYSIAIPDCLRKLPEGVLYYPYTMSGEELFSRVGVVGSSGECTTVSKELGKFLKDLEALQCDVRLCEELASDVAAILKVSPPSTRDSQNSIAQVIKLAYTLAGTDRKIQLSVDALPDNIL